MFQQKRRQERERRELEGDPTFGPGTLSVSATRLLDWSEKPLIALFFAVDKNPKSPIVYVYHAMKSQIVSDKDKLSNSPFDIRLIQIMRPSPHSTRVDLQGGWHTVQDSCGRKEWQGDLCTPGKNGLARPSNPEYCH